MGMTLSTERTLGWVCSRNTLYLGRLAEQVEWVVLSEGVWKSGKITKQRVFRWLVSYVKSYVYTVDYFYKKRSSNEKQENDLSPTTCQHRLGCCSTAAVLCGVRVRSLLWLYGCIPFAAFSVIVHATGEFSLNDNAAAIHCTTDNSGDMTADVQSPSSRCPDGIFCGLVRVPIAELNNVNTMKCLHCFSHGKKRGISSNLSKYLCQLPSLTSWPTALYFVF